MIPQCIVRVCGVRIFRSVFLTAGVSNVQKETRITDTSGSIDRMAQND